MISNEINAFVLIKYSIEKLIRENNNIYCRNLLTINPNFIFHSLIFRLLNWFFKKIKNKMNASYNEILF